MNKKLSNVFMGALILAVALLAEPSGGQAYTYNDLGSSGTQSLNDVWNMIPTNKGNTVDEHSPLIGGFSIDRIFGYDGDPGDQNYNTIFADYNAVGFVSFVNFHTTNPIKLTGVNLFASYDYDTGVRGMSSFSLLYSLDKGSTWQFLINNFVTKDNNTDRYTVVGTSYRAMAANFTFDEITAQYFRAEFTQYADKAGVRVNELDAIGTVVLPAQVVPLPGALLLLGGSLLRLARRRQG